jgi:hypothetical protein
MKKFKSYPLDEYPEVSEINFPKEIYIAFAVCGCGVNEFIVDGQSQVCQNCGKLNFRTEVRKYTLSDETAN